MEMVPLKAALRPRETHVKKLRKSGQVPCVLYGSGVQNTLLQCKELDLHRAFVKAGESTLVELEIESRKTPVLFKDISFEPVSGREIHADFYAVNMQKEIETEVPIRATGEAPAVKELGGVLVIVSAHVHVRCLPADLPHDLPVGIEKIAAFHDAVTVADLQLPPHVKVLEPPKTVLVTAQEPRKEEEFAPPPTTEAAAPEGVPSEEGASPTATEGAPAEAEAAPPKKEKEK